ncbi:MAG TPA: hypothetical protein VGV41_01985 [Pseudolabrys sp.]|jgi:hypothetical protein|uniref:hypothetical protein n=1 Tax=Pseudolabrys sp. TaxID=1960880 RepID=UPI002DDC9596|nr:hypothetical protein [Pseudolabrys sp.]HEV2627401.1 hypothetical protein [Pseudolabrys sp.]
MSISSIGIQTVTPTTGTGAQRPQSTEQQQQQSASNDNSAANGSAKSGSAQTLGRHVDKRV